MKIERELKNSMDIFSIDGENFDFYAPVERTINFLVKLIFRGKFEDLIDKNSFLINKIKI